MILVKNLLKKIVQILLRNLSILDLFNVNAENQLNETALHLAVKGSNTATASLLVRDTRISLCPQNTSGNTPLNLISGSACDKKTII